MLPQQFAGADVVRKHLFAEHDFVRHGSGRVVGHPARERVDGMPMQAAALEMGVGPGIGARVNSLHGFQGGERILRRVGLAHPLTVFHEGVPEITVLAGQRHGAGTEKNVAIHADVSPAQSLAPGLSWDGKLANRAPRLRVEMQHAIVRRDEHRVVSGDNVRTVHIHPHTNRAGDFSLPKKRAVVGVVSHHDLHALHYQSAVHGERAHRAGVPLDHVLRAGLAEPKHAKRPLHEPVVG